MDQEELFRRLAIALAIGLLIGLERGWQTRQESDHQRTAGLRTFALAGLLGGICGLMSIVSAPIVLAAGLIPSPLPSPLSVTWRPMPKITSA